MSIAGIKPFAYVAAGGIAATLAAGYAVYEHFFDFEPKEEKPPPPPEPNGPIVGGLPSFGRDRGKDVVGIDLQAGPQVAYSVPVEALQAGEQLRTSMQLGVSNDVASEEPADGVVDWHGTNRYDVRANARVVFADSPTATSGIELSRGDDFDITPEVHHAMDTQQGALDVPARLDGRSGYVNVVVDAGVLGGRGPTETVNVERPDMVDLGGKPLLTVDQGHGGIDVVRTPAAGTGAFAVTEQHSGPTLATSAVSGPAGVGDFDHPKVIALSLPLGSLRKGEVIEAVAHVGVANQADLSTLAKGELVLGDSPTDTDGPEVAAGHGTNLAPGEAGRELRHVGAFRADHAKGAAYLNYVITSGYVGANTVEGGALQVLGGTGGIDVTRSVPTRPSDRA